jgi:hypothetical protein
VWATLAATSTPGLTLYELLTLRPAFDASDRGGSPSGEQPSATSRAGDRHQPTGTIVRKATARRPERPSAYRPRLAGLPGGQADQRDRWGQQGGLAGAAEPQRRGFDFSGGAAGGRGRGSPSAASESPPPAEAEAHRAAPFFNSATEEQRRRPKRASLSSENRPVCDGPAHVPGDRGIALQHLQQASYDHATTAGLRFSHSTEPSEAQSVLAQSPAEAAGRRPRPCRRS